MQVEPAVQTKSQLSKKPVSLVLGGSLQRPISIPTDEEAKRARELQMEISRKCQLLQKAKLYDNPFDVMFAVLQTKFPGNFEHRQAKVREEVVKYFQEQLKMDINNSYCQPPMVDKSSKEILNMAVMVFGVDYMSTRNICEKFCMMESNKPQNHIQEVRWINDSNCLVIFENPQTLQFVLKYLVHEKNQSQLKPEENAGILTGWLRLKDYNILGCIQRQWFARFATSAELDLRKTQELIFYKNYESIKESLTHTLLLRHNALDEYDKILNNRDFLEKNKNRFRKRGPPLRTVGDTSAFREYTEKRPEKPDPFNQRPLVQQNQNIHANGTSMEVEKTSKPADKEVKVLAEEEMIDQSEEEALIEKVNNRNAQKSSLINQDVAKMIDEAEKGKSKPSAQNENVSISKPVPEPGQFHSKTVVQSQPPKSDPPVTVKPVAVANPTPTKVVDSNPPPSFPPQKNSVSSALIAPVVTHNPTPAATKPASVPVATKSTAPPSKPAPKPVPKPAVASNDDSY